MGEDVGPGLLHWPAATSGRPGVWFKADANLNFLVSFEQEAPSLHLCLARRLL
jgi:hypothetical protein